MTNLPPAPHNPLDPVPPSGYPSQPLSMYSPQQMFPPTMPGPSLKPHRGGAVLTLGIVGLVLNFGCGIGWILGIIAWVMANADLREMNAGIMDQSGRSNTEAGRICGIITVILSAIGLVIFLIYIVFTILIIGGAAAAGAGAHP